MFKRVRNADELKRRLIEVEREVSELKEKCDKKDKKYNLDIGSSQCQHFVSNRRKKIKPSFKTVP